MSSNLSPEALAFLKEKIKQGHLIRDIDLNQFENFSELGIMYLALSAVARDSTANEFQEVAIEINYWLQHEAMLGSDQLELLKYLTQQEKPVDISVLATHFKTNTTVVRRVLNELREVFGKKIFLPSYTNQIFLNWTVLEKVVVKSTASFYEFYDITSLDDEQKLLMKYVWEHQGQTLFEITSFFSTLWGKKITLTQLTRQIAAIKSALGLDPFVMKDFKLYLTTEPVAFTPSQPTKVSSSEPELLSEPAPAEDATEMRIDSQTEFFATPFTFSASAVGEFQQISENIRFRLTPNFVDIVNDSTGVSLRLAGNQAYFLYQLAFHAGEFISVEDSSPDESKLDIEQVKTLKSHLRSKLVTINDNSTIISIDSRYGGWSKLVLYTRNKHALSQQRPQTNEWVYLQAKIAFSEDGDRILMLSDTLAEYLLTAEPSRMLKVLLQNEGVFVEFEKLKAEAKNADALGWGFDQLNDAFKNFPPDANYKLELEIIERQGVALVERNLETGLLDYSNIFEQAQQKNTLEIGKDGSTAVYTEDKGCVFLKFKDRYTRLTETESKIFLVLVEKYNRFTLLSEFIERTGIENKVTRATHLENIENKLITLTGQQKFWMQNLTGYGPGFFAEVATLREAIDLYYLPVAQENASGIDFKKGFFIKVETVMVSITETEIGVFSENESKILEKLVDNFPAPVKVDVFSYWTPRQRDDAVSSLRQKIKKFELPVEIKRVGDTYELFIA